MNESVHFDSLKLSHYSLLICEVYLLMLQLHIAFDQVTIQTYPILSFPIRRPHLHHMEVEYSPHRGTFVLCSSLQKQHHFSVICIVIFLLSQLYTHRVHRLVKLAVHLVDQWSSISHYHFSYAGRSFISVVWAVRVGLLKTCIHWNLDGFEINVNRRTTSKWESQTILDAMGHWVLHRANNPEVSSILLCCTTSFIFL